jgi:flagellar assembly protein FliH
MHSANRVDVKMRMDVVGDGTEARSTVTPLIFQAAGRGGMETMQPETLFDPARAQAEADVTEGLRAQVKMLQAKVEMVRTESRAEGRAECAAEMNSMLEHERMAVVQACSAFAADRERYFTEVEGEVVRLALGIATRVLHREAQMDPLLLAASVRIALEKIADQPGTMLRVPAASVLQWRALFPDAAIAEVVGDEHMAAGDLVLESQVGRVELGVPVQLEEIEKGFFDLLQKRPV